MFTANCPEHGTQNITTMGPETVTLACGFTGNTDSHRHLTSDEAIAKLKAILSSV